MRAFVLVLGLAATAGCASAGAVPRPFPAPGPAGGRAVEPAVPPAAIPGVPRPAALARTALEFTGAPYRSGGADPSGFDCSGFVQFVLARHGIAAPREVRGQYRLGARVDRRQIRAGDLVFFSTVAPGASHVGIAISPDEFIHAPSTRGVVRVERLDADYWRRRFVGARRLG